MTNEPVVFLPGLGQEVEVWAHQAKSLPDGFEAVVLPWPGVLVPDAQGFTLAGAVVALWAELDGRGVGRAHLCGLSLGAMMATAFAIEHPNRVASLLLSGGQVHPPRALMMLQSMIMRMLPERVVTEGGLSKRGVLAILREVATMDLRGGLGSITAPTLVVCGTKDLVNLPAARTMAAGIPGAELQEVSGAGHSWNVELPEEFSRCLNDWLARR